MTFPRVETLAGVLIVVGMLAGCVPEESYWTPAEAPKSSSLEWITFVYEADFNRNSGKLLPVQRAQFGQFLKEIAVTRNDEIQVGPGTDALTPADAALAQRRSNDLRAMLHQNHLKATALPASPDAKSWDGKVLVKVGRWVLTPPRCRTWGVQDTDRPDNWGLPGLGCATAANLDLHVANAGDLVRGREPGPIDAEGSATYLRTWRVGKREIIYRPAPPSVPFER